MADWEQVPNGGLSVLLDEQMTTDLVPDEDGTRSIGSESRRVKKLWAGDIDISGAIAGVDAVDLTFDGSDTGFSSSTVKAAIQEAVSGYRFVDPRAHGAKVDGFTDDTTALNDAITNAKSNDLALYLPPGTLVYSASINLDGVRVFGLGPKKSILQFEGNGEAIELTSSGADTTLQDFQLKAGSGSHTHGIFAFPTIGGIQNSMFSNLKIIGFSNGKGVYMGNVWELTFIRVDVQGCDVGFQFSDSGSTNPANDVTLHSCNSRSNTSHALFLGNGDAFTVVGGNYANTGSQGSGGIGIEIDDKNGVVIIGAYVENNDVGIKITQSLGCTVQGGQIRSWAQGVGKGIVVGTVRDAYIAHGTFFHAMETAVEVGISGGGFPLRTTIGDYQVAADVNNRLLVANTSALVRYENSFFLKGTSSQRPDSAEEGQRFFDRTLGKPIWSDGAGGWVDATGTTV